MRYWYDCEFLEDGRVIMPISIGIVAEDNRELYLINGDYFDQLQDNHPNYVWNGHVVKPNQWVKDNVDPWLEEKYVLPYRFWGRFIKEFISNHGQYTERKEVELWGYYAAYDHVVLAQCFGPMIQLPEPIPMFTHEIKQLPGAKGPMPARDEVEHHALADARYQRKLWSDWSGRTGGVLQ